ncbi:DUF4351 domain-containing protein [Laspinema sp. D1]|uniref:transposase n=1 Tax=Laspinema palackyanum TaxID=3231601 RepID=UPI00348615E7|nr:DUF4351 domain-containing protein [Laspinema sp. D2b]
MSEPKIYPSVPADYDKPWKEALSLYFEQFLSFFFPELHDQIDWTVPYRSLEKELMELVRDSDVGTQFPDKLFEVKLINQQTVWILIHVEVQSQTDPEFNQRVYRYNYRAFDKYNKPVVSLAILGDDSPSWRPTEYSYSLDGYRLRMEFPTVKLLDYESQWEALESEENPFALMVRAHLKTQATNGKMTERQQWKWTLIRSLFEKGYTRDQMVNLFRFVDRMMSLPKELEQQLRTQVIRYREERQMPFLSPMEELIQEEAREQGRQEGMVQKQRENILKILQIRFGELPPEVLEALNGIEEMDILNPLLEQAIAIPSLAEFQVLLTSVKTSVE